MAGPELLYTLVQLLCGKAAHSDAAHIGQIALGEHQVQLMGGCPRIRPKHLIEVPQLVQYNIVGMGLFHNGILRPEIHIGRHGRVSHQGRGLRRTTGRIPCRRFFQMVTQILLHLCRGEIAALGNHLPDTLLYSGPLDNKFFCHWVFARTPSQC